MTFLRMDRYAKSV